jgi:hypothetical protein
MEKGRDAWSCRCAELEAGSPYDVNNMVDKDGNDIDCPLHPNCGCTLRPHLKTDDEILKAFKEEMAEELGIIEGTQEQKDMLDAIEQGLCPYCGRAFNSKIKNAKCPVCGKEMGDGELDVTSDSKPTFTNFSSITTTQEERDKKEYLAVLSEKAKLPAYEYEDYMRNKLKEYEISGKAWLESLPDDEKNGLKKITGNGYKQINNTLLGKFNPDDDKTYAGTKVFSKEETEKFINDIASALQKNPLQEAMTVFSGTKSKHYINSKYNVGKFTVLDQFISATPSYYHAWGEDNEKDMLLQIELPKGSHAGYVGVEGFNPNYHEREITVSCKQKYEILERGTCIHNGKEKAFMHLRLLI